MSADNQQGSHQFDEKILIDPSETTRRVPFEKIYKAYLLGALHDGTYNKLHKTFRISQKGVQWLMKLKNLLKQLRFVSWIYKEGKNRNVYVLETTASFLQMKYDPYAFSSSEEKVAYIRGYFDAEGGVPHHISDVFYIQICQKDKSEMEKIQCLLESFGIQCGVLHNPSRRVDPHYWRLFISRKSHKDFIKIISSWHSRKFRIFSQRVKI